MPWMSTLGSWLSKALLDVWYIQSSPYISCLTIWSRLSQCTLKIHLLIISVNFCSSWRPIPGYIVRLQEGVGFPDKANKVFGARRFHVDASQLNADMELSGNTTLSTYSLPTISSFAFFGLLTDCTSSNRLLFFETIWSLGAVALHSWAAITARPFVATPIRTGGGVARSTCCILEEVWIW